MAELKLTNNPCKFCNGEIDQDKRKDLVFTIQEDEAGHVEIIIYQQRPPCGDFQQVGHYSVPVPEEPAEIFTIKR